HRPVLELAGIMDEHDVARGRAVARTGTDFFDRDALRRGEPGESRGDQQPDQDASEQHDERSARDRLEGNASDFGHGSILDAKRARRSCPAPLWLSCGDVASGAY